MEKITLRVFWVCMLSCASTIIIGIWLGEDSAPEVPFKTAATFFVVGFANFLIWAPIVAYRFFGKI